MSGPYPDVPDAPGVPAVARNPAATSSAAPTPLTSDSPAVAEQASTEAQWAITDSGGAVAIKPDNFLRIEHATDVNIPDYPVEEGGFQSYNRVVRPVDVRLTVTKGGSVDDRTAFLAAIQKYLLSTDLLTVTTPEESYADMSLAHRDMRRDKDNGVTLLTVELHFVQIMNTATAAFSNTASPTGADPQAQGAVQPQTPTATQASAAAAGAH
ncbi:MAG TPA: hypothetical protein VG248_03395 [Caulobacteraceae bacterium]|jgi:hypothetical protein|nr:hypothetical protein [Caulobacteraceae bacterium]